jgi:hypothetical protein
MRHICSGRIWIIFARATCTKLCRRSGSR